MALQHIQLRLRKRLEDEEKKKKGAGKQYFGSMKKPAAPKAPVSALGRRLATQGPRPYAGPVSGTPERKQVIAGSRPRVTPSHFKAPSAPTPTGGAPDYQQKAWDLRDKMVADRQVAADAGADEIYKRILMLDEEGQKIVLDATRALHPEYIESMKEKGYISPEGVIAKMKEEKKVIESWIDPLTTEKMEMDEHGEVTGTGYYVPAATGTEQPSTSDALDEAIKIKELEDMYTKEGKETVDEAYNIIGPPPQKYIADKKTGRSVINPGYDEAYANWKNELYTEIARIKMLKGQAIDLNDLKLLYPNPEDIMFFQKNILGMENPTGEWSDETINLAIERLGGGA